MDKAWLNLAREALQQLDLPRARGLVRSYVSCYPQDGVGWHWLSRVVETREEKKRCLQRAVELNPQNAGARQELAELSRRIGPSAPSAPRAAVVKINPILPLNRAMVGHPPIRRTARLSWLRGVQWILLGLSLLVFLPTSAAAFAVLLGNRSVVVMSGSMEPALPVGAVVIAAPVPSKELEIGDVIIFSPNADAVMPIIHRIDSVRLKDGTRYYTTKGDANPTADPAEVTLPAIAWRMALCVPLVGYPISYAKSGLGTLTLIVIPSLLLGLFAIWNQIKNKSTQVGLAN